MNVEYTGRQYTISPSIRKEVETGLNKIRKILGDRFETKVILAVEKRRYKAEITIDPPNGPIVGMAQTGDMISAGIGRFGPYIKMGQQYKSLSPDDDVLNVGINRAVILLAEPSKGRFGQGASAGKPLGEHPDDKKPVTLNNGRFGPYIKWGKVMATVTKAYDPEAVTLAQALEIIAAKIAKGPSTFVKKGKKSVTEKAPKEEKPKAEKPKKAAPKKGKRAK